MRIGLQTWGSEGDCRPFVHLAAGLARAGHDVRLVVTEVAERSYVEDAATAGFLLSEVASPVICRAEEMVRLESDLMRAASPPVQARLLLERAFDPVSERVEGASRELAAWAELLVGHYFLPSVLAAAEAAGIPSVTVQFTPGFIPSRHTSPLGGRSLGALGNSLLWRLSAGITNRLLLHRANGTRRRFGLSPVRDVMREVWVSGALNLVAASGVLCPAQPDWPPGCRVTGALIGPRQSERMPEEVEALFQGGRPVVFFTFGSLMPTDERSVRMTLKLWSEAAELAGVGAVMQCPRPVDVDSSNDHRVVGRCPHDVVFPRCAAVVHHGGAGTLHACLRSGVPSVVVPHVADQFFWGATVKHLGLGAVTSRRAKVTAKELAKMIRSVIGNEQVSVACRRASLQIRTENGIEMAVREIQAVYEHV